MIISGDAAFQIAFEGFEKVTMMPLRNIVKQLVLVKAQWTFWRHGPRLRF